MSGRLLLTLAGLGAALLSTLGLVVGPVAMPTAQAGGGSPPAATVDVINVAFDPASVTINAGETLAWQLVAGRHTVTSNDGLFSSGQLGPEPFLFQFDTPGTYTYICAYHPISMIGEVVVLGAPAATPTASGSTAPVRTATPTASPTAEASHTVTSATATPTPLAQQSPTVPAPTPQQAEAGPASGGASPARALPSTGSARNQSPITFTRLVLGIWSAAALLLVVTGIGRLRRS